MGNSYSDIKKPFGTKKSVPKHLQPLKQKKKKSKSASTSVCSKSSNKQTSPPPILLIDNDDLTGEETVTELAGSGPRGAFRWFKGRRYLNYAEENDLSNTLLPNDQLELDRIRVLNFIIRWAFKGNVVAPVEKALRSGAQVLHVGFGPGMWPGHHIIDMALDYRNSQFTAVDILDLMPDDFEQDTLQDVTPPNAKMSQFTPLHPHLSLKLQNTTTPVIDSSTLNTDSTFSHSLLSQLEDDVSSDCSSAKKSKEEEKGKDYLAPKKRKLLQNLDFYQTHVVKDGLPFEDNSFDFVKQQLVTASLTLSDWKRVMTELVRVTKPGGYIQLLEIDYNTFNLGPKGRKWESDLINAARSKRYLEPRIALHLADLLQAVGMEEVSSKLVSVPLGSWGLDLGELWKQNMENFIDSTSPLLSRLMGVTAAEYKRQWHDLIEEIKDKKAFSSLHAAWGRKPMTSHTTIDWSLCPPFLNTLDDES